MSKQDEFSEKRGTVFNVEVEKQLRAISSGLRALERESSPEERACVIRTIYRHISILKRATRTVMRDVGTICQSMENVLARIETGKLERSEELFRALFRAVGTISFFLVNPRKKKTVDISALLEDLSYLERGENRCNS